MSDTTRDLHDDDDEFMIRLQSMAERAHEDVPRASGPSPDVWNEVLAAVAGHEQDGHKLLARRAATRRTQRVHRHGNSPTLHGTPAGYRTERVASHIAGRGAPRLPRKRAKATYVPVETVGVIKVTPSFSRAVALIALVVLVAGIWFSPVGPGSIFDEDEPVRYAAEVIFPSPSASPSSTPDLASYLPLEIPGVTCDVEPLTEDEVMDIVRNPENRVRQFQDPDIATSTRLIEDRTLDPSLYSRALETWGSRQPEPEEYAPIRDAADEFWNCLRVGTSFQVWNLIDPYLVQQEVLWPFPVLRDEGSIRGYISRFGPQRYSASVAPRFPDLNGGEGPYAERYANPDPNTAILPESEYGGLMLAYVDMQLSANPSSSYMIVFRDFGNGVWRAVGMYFDG